MMLTKAYEIVEDYMDEKPLDENEDESTDKEDNLDNLSIDSEEE